MKATRRWRVVAALAWLVPASVVAQTGNSGIAGVVRDTNGGVLPGVTVEASRPALIEQRPTQLQKGRWAKIGAQVDF